jgi:hypothetical protein
MTDHVHATARTASAFDTGGRTTPARSASVRLLAATVCMLCAAAGLMLALHYPIGPPLGASAAFAAIAFGTVAWPGVWILVLPAVLALVGFAPWTGWITFEELDMLVLATATGGYARLALERARPGNAGLDRDNASVALTTRLLVALYALSICASFIRGVSDAGGLDFGWFQGYQGPMNSVRLGKSFVFALLLFPLWREAHAAAPLKSSRRWSAGLCLGLAGVSVAALWERLAFTGLLDFSTDYRTTALFWEMHVGGAALDGFLALTVPFAVRELQTATRGWRLMGVLAILGVASYACLTTFSRGVFLAIPAGLATMGWLALRQRPTGSATATPATASIIPAAGFVLVYAAAAFWIFPAAGYRGMLALLGAFALLMRLGGGPRATVPPRGWQALALALALSALAAAIAWRMPKGAYLAYALAFAFAAAMAFAPRTRWMALAGYAAAVVSLGLVCLRWGGEPALARALPVVAVLLSAALLLAFTRAGREGVWPRSPRWQGIVMACLVATSGAIGVMVGGAYMTDRMATAEGDLQTRVDHWTEGIGVLRSPVRWAFGVGLGRYPATYFLLHDGTDAPGDYALRGSAGDATLVLTGGRHVIGWGELLRVSQRVRAPRQPVVAELKVRTDRPAGLHLEVCEKHLLYNGACLLKEIVVSPTGSRWQTIRTPLDGAAVSRGDWFAPRLLSFSIGNETRGTLLEVRDIQLVDASGDDLLVNGDFSRGMARWFFSSDRNHLPWHLKNVFVHVLFDQGLFGLGVFVLMLVGGLWRLGFGSAREHPLAPAISGAIVGFGVVGLFDSLVDVPRDAFVFYFLLLQALSLHSLRRA